MLIHRNDWFYLLVGVFLVYGAFRDMATGNSLLFRTTVNRSENALLYWSAVFLSALLGVGLVLSVLLRWIGLL